MVQARELGTARGHGHPRVLAGRLLALLLSQLSTYLGSAAELWQGTQRASPDPPLLTEEVGKHTEPIKPLSGHSTAGAKGHVRTRKPKPYTWPPSGPGEPGPPPSPHLPAKGILAAQ